MPTTPNQAFAAAGLTREAVVRWGTIPSTFESGVYVVSVTDSLNNLDSALSDAPFSAQVFQRWLDVRPELTLDRMRPTVDLLVDRIGRFWIADEVILYFGLATSLSVRLAQYYETPIGARGPHAGGYFLKLLSNLDRLWVHYVPCDDPESAEDAMLGRFCEHVSREAKQALHDPAHPFPFANLEWPRGVRKKHGLRGAREPRRVASNSTRKHGRQGALFAPAPLAGCGGPHTTQRVTAADLQRGQIRIPSTGVSSTKTLFPVAKATVQVLLRGRSMHGSWDPRMGPNHERSGVLRVGVALRDLVRADEVLTVSIANRGTIAIS